MSAGSKDIKLLLRGFSFLFKIEKLYALLHIVTSILSPLKPYINIYMTAVIINAIEKQRITSHIILLSLITILLNFLFDLLLSYLNHKKAFRLEQFYKSEQMFFAEHSMLMQYKYIEDANVYNLKERVKSESQNGYNMFYLNAFSGQLISSISSIISATLLSIELFTRTSISLPFKAIIITIIIVVVGINYFTTKESNKKNIDMYNKLVPYNSMFNFYTEYNENYNAGKDVRIYNMGEKIAERISAMNSNAGKTILNTKRRTIKYVILQIINTETLSFFAYAFVIMACIQGDISVGDITKYVSSIVLLTGGISAFIQNYQSLINNNRYLKNYFSYFDIPEVVESENNNEYVRSTDGYTIEFKNVSFSYPNSTNHALKNVSFVIYPGEKVAVVGKNGSGKTTMIKLLCRLYEPDDGEIYINDQNIKDIDFKEHVKILSVVFQDFKLFAFSLKQNIVLANKCSEANLQEAINKAGLTEFVNKYIDGIDTVLYKDFDEKGIEISGGEGQKVAIARALYRMSEIFVLDEPTAALDPISENEIYRNFNNAVNKKTTVFISHRMAACMFCDKILVFNEGKLNQIGNHKALLKEKDSLYYELWSSQAKYYNE